MQGLSAFINFKENLSKNAPYYNLLIRKIDSSDSCSPTRNIWLGEQAVISSGTCGNIISRICEGYQFTIAFRGSLEHSDSLKAELSDFGYHFLSEKDSEVALICYIHYGEKCAEKLSGSFSFIIYDAMRRQVFALSDKFAEFPLFYAKTRDGYILSSSLKGIFAHHHTSRNLTAQSILDILSASNQVPQRIFEDVYVLPGATCLKITASGISQKSADPPPCDTHLPPGDDYDVISPTPVADIAALLKLSEIRGAFGQRFTIYGETFADAKKLPFRLQNFSIDDGSVYNALETSVSACGIPVLSANDFRLPLAIRKGCGDNTLIFPAPDRFSPPKNYLSSLIKNCAFHPAIENNFTTYTKSESTSLCYPMLIADHLNVNLQPVSAFCDAYYNKEETTTAYTESGAVKTALRHILLDIISKEYAPILAFFRRAALLRLCEGGFSFLPNQSEGELIAYIIKLNMWFEIFRPKIA